MNRESWLKELTERLNVTLFNSKMPENYRVTCGWPSRNALAKQRQYIGQCFPPGASSDRHVEIIISMCLDDPMEVAETLAHEMVHAVVGTKCGHRGPFKRLALEIGLEGKMTESNASVEFKAKVSPILVELGPYPHAKITYRPSVRNKQSTRLIKSSCHCGYTVRITRKWIDLVGAPVCPLHSKESMSVDIQSRVAS